MTSNEVMHSSAGETFQIKAHRQCLLLVSINRNAPPDTLFSLSEFLVRESDTYRQLHG